MEKITVYVPEELREILRRRKVSMSQFCRSAIKIHLKYEKSKGKWARNRYNNNPELRNQILEAGRERYKENNYYEKNKDRKNAYQVLRSRGWLDPKNFDDISIGTTF